MSQPSEPSEQRLDGLETEFNRKTNILLDEIVVLRDEMEGLTRRVSQIADGQQLLQEGQQQMQTARANLSNLMGQIAEAAEVHRVELAQNSSADRASVREIADSVATLATENQRIWEYLQSQIRTQGNGHS